MFCAKSSPWAGTARTFEAVTTKRIVPSDAVPIQCAAPECRTVLEPLPPPGRDALLRMSPPAARLAMGESPQIIPARAPDSATAGRSSARGLTERLLLSTWLTPDCSYPSVLRERSPPRSRTNQAAR